MQQKPTIQYLSTVFLFLVFAFGITPKKTWHDLIATHQDGKNASYDYFAKGDQLHKSVIHCSCDLQEAESPFVTVPVGLQPHLLGSPAVANLERSQDPQFQQTHFYGLRGPPAIV